MDARAFLIATDKNAKLCILFRDAFKYPRNIQTVRDDSWSNIVSIGEQQVFLVSETNLTQK